MQTVGFDATSKLFYVQYTVPDGSHTDFYYLDPSTKAEVGQNALLLFDKGLDKALFVTAINNTPVPHA